MQEPANMPLDVLCHELDRKHVSTVYQFHNIYKCVSIIHVRSGCHSR
jgi:hypothetical protein